MSMADDIRALVGLNIRRLRIAAGLTQAKLAELMDVDRGYVSGLELGQRKSDNCDFPGILPRLLGPRSGHSLRKLSRLAVPRPDGKHVLSRMFGEFYLDNRPGWHFVANGSSKGPLIN